MQVRLITATGQQLTMFDHGDLQQKEIYNRINPILRQVSMMYPHQILAYYTNTTAYPLSKPSLGTTSVLQCLGNWYFSVGTWVGKHRKSSFIIQKKVHSACLMDISHVKGGVICAKMDGNSVTRLGNLLDFGQLFKAFGNN